MPTAGWRFEAIKPSGLEVQFHPMIGGSLSHDWQRPVRRAISGVTLLGPEAARLDLVADKVRLSLILDGAVLPMGIFNFSESTRQPAVIIDQQTGAVADILTTSLADQMIRLRRSEGTPENLLSGSDPAQEMQRILADCGLQYAVAGPVSPTRANVTWNGDTLDYAKISTLADLAGHRPPWADNAGVIRSVVANALSMEVIDLMDLQPENGTLSITENYLGAPNRVIVYDNTSVNAPIVGIWNAPASAPHSEANRGWVLTERQQMQGLSGGEHAQQVAESIGEQFTARALGFSVAVPTNRLDGPVLLSYDDTLWLTTGWSIPLTPNSRMSVSATEMK